MGVSGLLKDAEYFVRRRARPGVLCSCACSYLCGSGADQVMPGAFAPGTGCGRLQAPSGKIIFKTLLSVDFFGYRLYKDNTRIKNNYEHQTISVWG